jgi:hypothetical protein
MVDLVHKPPTNYWFPAKTYGWGWGPPITWQGWAVMAVFVALLFGGIAFLLPAYGHQVFVAYTVGLGAMLIGICWLKGEPPHWRWGDK